MPEVIVVNLAWITSMYNHLRVAKSNVWNVEINTYDLGKADALQASMRQIDDVMQSLNKVIINPEKYMLNR